MFVFRFYTTKSRAYIRAFETILVYLANKHNLSFASVFDKDSTPYSFLFYLKGENAQILEFANAVSRELPLSIYFVFDTIIAITKDSSLDSTTTSLVHNMPKHFYYHSNTKPKIPTIRQIQALNDSFSQSHIIKPFGVFFDRIYYQNNKLHSKNTYQYLHEMVINIKNGALVSIQTQRGVFGLSLQKSEQILFWDMSALQTFMRVDSVQLSILGSFEKPSMKLCPKDVFKNEILYGENVQAQCIVAFDSMLMLLGILARSYDMEYVFLHKSSKEKDLSYTLTYTLPKHQLLVCDTNGVFIEDKKTQKNLFAIIKHHYPKDKQPNPQPSHSQKTNTSTKLHSDKKLIYYFSSTHDSAIWTYDTSFHQLLGIDFSLNPKDILHMLESNYTDANKLIANYKAHFGAEALAFGTSQSESRHSHNLIEFFSIIAKVLGYCPKDAPIAQGIKAIIDNATLFVRDKGPRIDYKIIKNTQGEIILDCPRILRSCMSFALAGLDAPTLCYGVLDSMCEFLGNFAQDIKQNYSIQDVFLCGDMLTHKVFLDKILHYLPKDISLVLPQDGWVDTF